MFMRSIRAISLLVLALFSTAALAQGNGWSTYKQRFLMADGRIVDTANKNVSHTEGQGFSMLLAVFNNDRQTFDKLWQWSNANLFRSDVGMYSWRYDPNSVPKVADKNTASDGDTLMAWALLLAGDKWHDSRYTQASEKLQAALIKHTVIKYAGYTVMLPGLSGFNQTTSVTVNPSYFLFPAWQAFYQHSHLKVWKDLDASALAMLGRMTFGQYRLPSDWVTLNADGTLAPASKWPALFSYDAIRIPLYLRWAHPGQAALAPYIQFWQQTPRNATPAWVNVLSGAKANYMMSPGQLAIRDFTMANTGAISDQLSQGDDYYSSSLQLLAWWAANGAH
ncbi:MAG: glycosyl hydrolase family 8 [Gibbsiella quercinecans]|uniref:glycosyl hydrolase family 8 n=1 Tax=Gibbsiella quercinecans TaxID=929813 RepID=UPI003F34B3E3